MTRLRDFRPEDVVGLPLQSMQAMDLTATLDMDYGLELAAGEAWTATTPGGAVLGCGGIMPVAGRGHYGVAWTLLTPGIGRALLLATREARRRIAGGQWKRVEALVRADWPAAACWARLCGLSERAELRHWGPNGETFLLFDWTAP